MAKQELPVDFKDDVLQAEMAGKRKYRIIQNEDGTISLEDVTNYSQIGSNFGAAQMNATNLAVNESFDKNKVIDSLADIVANEATGYAAGALAVRELNGKLKNAMDGGVVSTRVGNQSTVVVEIPFNKKFTSPPAISCSIETTQIYADKIAVKSVSTTMAEVYVNTSTTEHSAKVHWTAVSVD